MQEENIVIWYGKKTKQKKYRRFVNFQQIISYTNVINIWDLKSIICTYSYSILQLF